MIAVRWIRLDSEYMRDGRVRRSGVAWLWPPVVALCKRLGGRVLIADADPDLLAADIHLPASTIRAGLLRFAEVGLLKIDGDHYVIPDWQDHQTDPVPVRERVAAHRAKKAQAALVTTVTNSRYGNACNDGNATRLEETRLEETRLEETSLNAGGGLAPSVDAVPYSSRAPMHDLTRGAPDLELLETIAIVESCTGIPGREGHGPRTLSGPETAHLMSLLAVHGHTRVREVVIGQCAGDSFPVRSASRLMRRPASTQRQIPGPILGSASYINATWGIPE
jgi:hypothetical protein